MHFVNDLDLEHIFKYLKLSIRERKSIRIYDILCITMSFQPEIFILTMQKISRIEILTQFTKRLFQIIQPQFGYGELVSSHIYI